MMDENVMTCSHPSLHVNTYSLINGNIIRLTNKQNKQSIIAKLKQNISSSPTSSLHYDINIERQGLLE